MKPIAVLGLMGAAWLLLRRTTPPPFTEPEPEPPEPEDPPVPEDHAPHELPGVPAADLARLAGVNPRLVAVIERAAEQGPIRFRVVDSVRTVDDQVAAVERGASPCDPRKGHPCAHVEKRAVDLAPYVNGKLELADPGPYEPLAAQVLRAADDLGVKVSWGGTALVGSFYKQGDAPHFELQRVDAEPRTAGYHRAQQAEVTPSMTARAKRELVHPLGDIRGPFLDDAGTRFLVALEVHSNAPKGASVFIADNSNKEPTA